MDHNPRVWSKVDTACCGQSLLKFSVAWQRISRDKRFPEDGRKCCSRSWFFLVVAVTFRQGTRLLQNPALGDLLRGTLSNDLRDLVV